MLSFIHKRSGSSVSAKTPISAAKKIANELYKNKTINTVQFSIRECKTQKIYHYIVMKENGKIIVKPKHERVSGGTNKFVIRAIDRNKLQQNYQVVLYDNISKKYISASGSDDLYEWRNQKKKIVGQKYTLADEVTKDCIFEIKKTKDHDNTTTLIIFESVNSDDYHAFAYQDSPGYIFETEEGIEKTIHSEFYISNNPINNDNIFFVLDRNFNFTPLHNRNKIIGQNIEVKLVFPSPVSYLHSRETGNKTQ